VGCIIGVDEHREQDALFVLVQIHEIQIKLQGQQETLFQVRPMKAIEEYLHNYWESV
jgi:hypothetical protein